MRTGYEVTSLLLSNSKDFTLLKRIVFWTSSKRLQIWRGLKNQLERQSQYHYAPPNHFPFQLASSQTVLRSGRPEERVFEDGKIENLRTACQRINGLVVKKGEIFSFWSVIGRPRPERGFSVGREIRFGCLIPSIGGGLCQISGALNEVCLDAGISIVESHRHTRRLPGLPYNPKTDATVFWNYVDFRFRPEQNVRLSADIENENLIVTVSSDSPPKSNLIQEPSGPMAPKANDCLNCGRSSCSMHRKTFEIRDHLTEKPFVGSFAPPDLTRVFNVRSKKNHNYLSRLKMRSCARRQPLAYCRWKALAQSARRPISLAGTPWIQQELLPHLWPQSRLNNTPYNVWLNHLPLGILQHKLDELVQLWPEAISLREFRLDKDWIDSEVDALENATAIHTSHPWLSRLVPRATFHERPQTFTPRPPCHSRPYLFFPGPVAAREGCFSVAELGRRLKMKVLTVGRQIEPHSAEFRDWIYLKSEKQINWTEVAAFVQPALFESYPRLALLALSHGVPCVVSEGVGLIGGPGVQNVDFQTFPIKNNESIFSSEDR